MMDKPSLAASRDVILHPVTANGNSRQAKTFPQLRHQFVATHIGQAEVADHEIELREPGQFQRLTA
jgi:hypothetical protein